MANFSKIPWIADHIELYRTDPGAAHMWDSSVLGGPGILPTLLLTTRGRVSGEPRSLPLIYGTHEDGYVVIASKGGDREHPLWYKNLKACPRCDLQVSTKALSAVARVAEGAEREALWQKMVGIYAPYADYQAATNRVIPVVVLETV